MDTTRTDKTWVLQCRPGFEPECLAEAAGRTASRGEICGEGSVALEAGTALPPLHELTFARQAFRQIAALADLPTGDRINAILVALRGHATPVRDILLEHPDSNAGKELSGF